MAWPLCSSQRGPVLIQSFIIKSNSYKILIKSIIQIIKLSWNIVSIFISVSEKVRTQYPAPLQKKERRKKEILSWIASGLTQMPPYTDCHLCLPSGTQHRWLYTSKAVRTRQAPKACGQAVAIAGCGMVWCGALPVFPKHAEHCAPWKRHSLATCRKSQICPLGWPGCT